MLKLQIPKKDGICRIAADEFASFWRRITGIRLTVTEKDDGKSDLVIFGSDAVNSLAHAKIIEKVIPQFRVRTGTDDYQLISARDGKRTLLFIASGRPRALLYGVYHFFEEFAGCRYFWDGDVVPKRKEISLEGIDVLESPRFEYRGLRYFAHRSLNRFQAEHWDFAEWKREIDWVLKRRLNMFMLRIGLDDLFQKAFPEVVRYPGWEVPESMERSYDDRNLFWSLKYRGELRKKILAYARERDLLHPEDLGTMTHWYSRTPYDFLNRVKPDFLPQATSSYGEKTGLVWDIRQDENLENYFKLTETHIREYGSPDLFHTIGLAERRCYSDYESNHQMKLYTYRRIIAKLREKYPHAPLLIGTWDFCMHWTPQEVHALLKELDPANTLIFDYTSDTTDEKNNFQGWDLVGRFPWIFGIFHAYEPASDIRGNYEQIARRLPVAARDPMCKGLVYWPECSHTDTLMLDFMSALAWDPSNAEIDDFLPGFCHRRYGGNAKSMLDMWRKALPLAKLSGWPGPQDLTQPTTTFSDYIFWIPHLAVWRELNSKFHYDNVRLVQKFEPEMPLVPELLRLLAKTAAGKLDDFRRRDLLDLGRLAVSRIQNFAFARLFLAVAAWLMGEGDPRKVFSLLKLLIETAELEEQLLSAHEDYSMYDSLKLLEKKHETNPNFEKTLKGNAENSYCRSYVSELFRGVYLPEVRALGDFITRKIRAGERTGWEKPKELAKQIQEIRDRFYDTPLAKLAPDHAKAFAALPRTLEKLAVAAEKIITLGKKEKK